MTMRFLLSSLFIFFGSHQEVASLNVVQHGLNRAVQHRASRQARSMSSVEEAVAETKTAASTQLSVPLSWDEMVRQASKAMKEAEARGDRRQIVRVLLPRDSANADFGKYVEADEKSGSTMSSMSLVPPDESWQGGIMQLYRAAAPTAESMMQELASSFSASGVPSRITESREVDESGVDGIGLLQTDDNKLACYVQPTQETMDYVEDGIYESSSVENRTVVLFNPQWRLVDDALDVASKQEGFLGNLASFLGGKGSTQKRLQDSGFKAVYTLEGYVCRGANVRLFKVLDGDWSVFCQRDNGESFIPVGTQAARPTYQEVETMLNDAGIGYKYARDMGMSPKL